MAEPKFKRGEHVNYDLGGGARVGHFHHGPVEQHGEEKFAIQVADGSVQALAYREPKDRDDNGAGGTFWPL